MDPSQSQHSTDSQGSTDTHGSNEDPVEPMDPPPSQPSADFYGTRDRPPGRNEDPVKHMGPAPSQPSGDFSGSRDRPMDLTEDTSRDKPSTSGTRDPARGIKRDLNPPQPPTHGVPGARHSPGIDRNTHPNPSQRSKVILENRGPSAELPVFSPSQYLDSYYRPEFRQRWLENESTYVFKVFLPTGMNTKGFTKEIGNDGILLINGEEYMKAPEEAKNNILGWKILRSYLLRLDIRIKLPENVLPEAVSVELGMEVITVTLPKRRVEALQAPFGKITIFKYPH